MATKPVVVFLMQLGGPKDSESIFSFQYNLFSDVMGLLKIPAWLSKALGYTVACLRTPKIKPVYAQMGGGSPILANTQAQADALQRQLRQCGWDALVLIAMRYAPPRAAEAIRIAQQFSQQHALVPWLLCPLYPHYSFATTRSSLREFKTLLSAEQASRTYVIEQYHSNQGYIEAVVETIVQSLAALPAAQQSQIHLVFSAHGLPVRLVKDGDPYPEHIAQTMNAALQALRAKHIHNPASLCYQSRVGPIAWLKPSTSEMLKTLAKQGQHQVAVIPIAFVSEHIETLQELDDELRKEAMEAGITTYIRVPTVGTNPHFIAGLAAEITSCLAAAPSGLAQECGHRNCCPPGRCRLKASGALSAT